MPSVLHITEGSWGCSSIYKEKETSAKQIKSKEHALEPTPRFDVTSKSLNLFDDSDDTEDEESLGKESQESEIIVLPFFLSSLFGTILEDTATELRILVEGSNEIKIIKTKSDWDVLVRKKFGVEEPTCVDELEGINVKNLGSNEYKINKLDTDRIYVIDIIKKLYADISLKKSFKTLENSVKAILALQNYRMALAEEEANNRIVRRDLARQLRQLRNHIKSSIYDSDVKIDELTSQIADIVLVSECRSRFIDNWQRARTEQHSETISDTETDLNQSIRYYKIRSDQEHRVHMEIETVMSIIINDTLEKVEDMMSKYDVDMESIDLKIQIQKNDYKNAQDKRIEIQKVIDEHGKEMSTWVQFKDHREEARLYREKMNNAAVAVQAWWRGLLVRQQLGPFKPTKRRGHPPPAEKKKKK